MSGGGLSGPGEGTTGGAPGDEAGAPIDRVGRLFLEAVRLDRSLPEVALRDARKALEEGVGGFIIFGGRVEDVRRMTGELREAASRPLWFAADLERGAGQQFAGASTLPPPAALARHPEAESAVRRAARLTAREARSLGLNWIFAPVLDLDVEPSNPIVGTRSFGADPHRVARLGRAWIEACQQEGVAACAKHFPGHGRTTTDSHLEMPVVDAPREVLEQDLLPFRDVTDMVASVMTAHVAYPELCGLDTPEGALHGDTPATLNRLLVGELLRGELGFDGLVVTDALIMDALGTGAGAAAEGWLAVRALRAGCDLLLYPSDLALAVRTVRQAAENDARLVKVMGRALARRDRALERFAATPGGEESPGEEAIDPVALGEAVVLQVGGSPGEVLSSRELPTRLHVISDDPGGGRPEFGAAFEETLRERGWNLRSSADEQEASEDDRHLVLLESTPRGWKGRAGLSSATATRVRSSLGGAGDGYLVLCGHPRLLRELGVPGACAWSAEPVMEQAAARWLDARLTDA